MVRSRHGPARVDLVTGDRLQSVFMAVELVGSAQLHVTLATEPAQFHLRFYGSEEFIVPVWWIGVSDAKRELRRTEVLPGMDHGPEEVGRWMEPITGEEAAGQLIRLAIRAGLDVAREAAAATP